jgi:phospholipid transport system substrate-binding protein
LAIAAVGVARWVAAEQAYSVADAQKFLQQSGDKLAAILNGPGEWSDKSRKVEALIDQAMDVAGIARFALGRSWNVATDAQRGEIVRLFPSVLVGNVGRTIGAYQSFAFTIHRGTQINDTVEISTTVLRPGDAPRQVVWMVAWIAGAPKIVDIIAEGTSMRITQRDDCAGFLQQNNHSIPALIETLRREAAAATS